MKLINYAIDRKKLNFILTNNFGWDSYQVSEELSLEEWWNHWWSFSFIWELFAVWRTSESNHHCSVEIAHSLDGAQILILIQNEPSWRRQANPVWKRTFGKQTFQNISEHFQTFPNIFSRLNWGSHQKRARNSFQSFFNRFAFDFIANWSISDYFWIHINPNALFSQAKLFHCFIHAMFRQEFQRNFETVLVLEVHWDLQPKSSPFQHSKSFEISRKKSF